MEIQVKWGHGQPLESHTCGAGPKQWRGCNLMRSSGLMREWSSPSNTWLSPRLRVAFCLFWFMFFGVITWRHFTKSENSCCERLVLSTSHAIEATVSEAAGHPIFTQWTWSVCSRPLTRIHSWPHHYNSTCVGQAAVDTAGQSSRSKHHDLTPRRLLLMDSCSS